MPVRGPNNAGRAVQTDPTLLRYASVITEQKKCRDLFAQNFNRFQTLHKNSQQYAKTCSGVCKRRQQVTLSVGSCWPTMLGPFSLFTARYVLHFQLGATRPSIIKRHCIGNKSGFESNTRCATRRILWPL